MFKKITLLSSLIFTLINVQAQDSVIPDISYPYLEKLIASAKNNYPRIKAYRFRTELAKTNVNKAKLSWFDLLTFSYIYQPNNTLNYSVPSTNATTTTNRFLFNGIQLGLSLNLGSVLVKPANVQVAKIDYKIANEDQEEYILTLTTDVKRRYFTYLLQQNLVKTQTQIYQDMQMALKQTKYKFQKGELAFEVYNASLLNASAHAEQKMQAETNFLIAKSDLEALIGAKLEDIK